MTTMNGESTVWLIGKASAATKSGKRSASRANGPDQQRSELFLKILRTRLAKTDVFSGKQLRTKAHPDVAAPSKGKAIREQSSKKSSGEPIERIALIPMADSPQCRAHRIQPEIGLGSSELRGKSEKAAEQTHRQSKAKMRSQAKLDPNSTSSSVDEKAPATLIPKSRRARSRSGAALKALTRRRVGRRAQAASSRHSAIKLVRARGNVGSNRHINISVLAGATRAEKPTSTLIIDQSLKTQSGNRLHRQTLTARPPTGPVSKASGERVAAKGVATASARTALGSRIRTSRGVSPSSPNAPSRRAAKPIHSHQTLAGKMAAQRPSTQKLSANTTSRANPVEGKGALRLKAGGASFRPMRRAPHLSDKSSHSSNSTFQKASVGIWRRVLPNKGHTQPHSRPSNSRQNSYLPATSNATRRWLPSKATRFRGRSESHHPSFRALGHPQRGGSKTSGLKSSGRIPSLYAELRAKFELEVQSPKSKVVSSKLRVSRRAMAGGSGKKIASGRPAQVLTKSGRGKAPAQLSRNGRATIAAKAVERKMMATRQEKRSDIDQGAGVKPREAKPNRLQSIVRNERPAKRSMMHEKINGGVKTIGAKSPASVRPTPEVKAGKIVKPLQAPVAKVKPVSVIARAKSANVKAESAIAKAKLTIAQAKPTIAQAKPTVAKSEPIIAKQLESSSRQSPRAMGGDASPRLNARESLPTHRPQKAPQASEAVRTLGSRGKAANESRVRPRLHNLNTRKIMGLKSSDKPATKALRASSDAVEKRPNVPRPRPGVADLRSTERAVKPGVKQGLESPISRVASGPRPQVMTSRPESKVSTSVRSPAMEKSHLSRPGTGDLSKAHRNVEGTKVAGKQPGLSSAAKSPPRQETPRQDASRQSRAVEVKRTDARMSSRQNSSAAKADVKSSARAGAEGYTVKVTDSAVKKEFISSLTKEPDARKEGRPISSDKPRAEVTTKVSVSDDARAPADKRQPSVVRSSATRADVQTKHETSAKVGADSRLESSAMPADDAPHKPSRSDTQTRIATPNKSPGTQSGNKAAQTRPVERIEDSSSQYVSKEEALNKSDREHRNVAKTLDESPSRIRNGSESSTKAVVRSTAPVQPNGSAGVVNAKASSGQVMSQGLRDAPPVEARLESDMKPSIAQQLQGTSWDVTARSRADGASAGFQTNLAAPGTLLPQVAAYMRRLLRSGKQEMRIRLNPPELGAMRIRIRIEGGGVKARLMVDQAQAHAVLKDNMSALWRTLQEQGLKVDSLSVEVSGGADEFGFSSHNERQGGRRDGRGSTQSSEPWRDAVDETMLPTAAQLSSSRLLDVVV